MVLEPKHAVVEYGRKYRSHIKFVEGGAENIPSPGEYFDKVVASLISSFSTSGQRFRGNEESVHRHFVSYHSLDFVYHLVLDLSEVLKINN